jgi:hypothetical protein
MAGADADPRPLGTRIADEFSAWLTAMACAAIPLTELLIGSTWADVNERHVVKSRTTKPPASSIMK